ncbi:MAG: ABC transporter permease [Chloroflexi bacterium]|nr:ABC transporter permease [Chloroflexota bacterium]
MTALLALTLANIRSYVRDRAALFWTLAFPLVFIVMFGLIFSSSTARLSLALVDQDGSAAATALTAALSEQAGVELTALPEDEARARMTNGDVDGVVIVPAGYGQRLAAATTGSARPAELRVLTDASRAQLAGSVFQAVGNVLGVINLGGRTPLVAPLGETVQTENLNAISYFVPSMLGLSVMQVGIFAAIPLVADREKLILKRLAATPLRRWQLVGSNVLMRLLIALTQTIIIVAVGALAFGVDIVGSLALTFAFVVLGAMTFLALGYVIASFASTEDAANGMTSMIQFPMMFLSGSFFQIDQMPDFLQGIARIIPLTYLSDALRQVMVGGAAFAPLWLCAAVLIGWLGLCFGIAAVKFRWQ